MCHTETDSTTTNISLYIYWELSAMWKVCDRVQMLKEEWDWARCEPYLCHLSHQRHTSTQPIWIYEIHIVNCCCRSERYCTGCNIILLRIWQEGLENNSATPVTMCNTYYNTTKIQLYHQCKISQLIFWMSQTMSYLCLYLALNVNSLNNTVSCVSACHHLSYTTV